MPVGDALVGIAVEALVALMHTGLDPRRLRAEHQMGALGRRRQLGVDCAGVGMHQLTRLLLSRIDEGSRPENYAEVDGP